MNETSIDLALRLLQLAADAADFGPQNADLFDPDARTGALDAVIDALERGDVPSALGRLDAAILLAAQPLAPPATGYAVKQRKNLLRVAKSISPFFKAGRKKNGGAA